MESADCVLDRPTEAGQDYAALDCLHHPGDGQDARVVVHDRPFPLQAYVGNGHRTQPLQGPPDPEGSEGADHSGDGEFRAVVAGGPFQRLRLNQASHGSDTEIPQLHLHTIPHAIASPASSTVVTGEPRVKGNPPCCPPRGYPEGVVLPLLKKDKGPGRDHRPGPFTSTEPWVGQHAAP
jgi:hypothetical protein